jgi:hypothetical protein
VADIEAGRRSPEPRRGMRYAKISKMQELWVVVAFFRGHGEA